MRNAKYFLISSTIVFMHGCQIWPSQGVGELPPPAALPATSESGTVQFRIWTGISGNDVSDLTSIAAYPDNPNTVKDLTSLNNEGGLGDNYGSLVRGFIEAPASGEYRFYVAGDDETQFLLSPSEVAGDAEVIASVPTWSNPGDYGRFASQTSGIKTLAKGKRYYFEIRHKQGNGGEHFEVAWEGPGISRQIVASAYLYSEGQPGVSEDISSNEAYSLGYRVGYFDSSEDLAFNPAFPPLDNDQDGIYDNWETVNGLDPTDSSDSNSDPDGDFLTAADEFLIGTRENNPDTDEDGIPDGQEFAYNLNPLDGDDASRDADADGYTNLEEYQAGTDPNNAEEMPSGGTGGETGTGATMVSGFVGQYFSGTDFDSFVASRKDATVDFDWGSGSPMSGINNDNYSVRWITEFTAPHSSGSRTYEFAARTDDGVRLFVDGQRVINDWTGHAAQTFTYEKSLSAGETVPIRLEYYEASGNAVAQFSVTDTSNGNNVSIADTMSVPDPDTSSSQDTDSDGIPDTWELSYGLNPWVNDASDVSNSSGVSNIDAYQSELDPWTLEATAAGGDGGGSPPPPPPTTSSGEVTVSWTAPSTRLDGSSIDLSEIDHYTINYGTSSSNLNQSVDVGSDQTSYTFDGLDSGTWYFTVKTVDNNGLTSPPSSVVSETIP